ncbi:MAG: hypothetical protein LC808_22510 [Actinobacteria bacterium]|nr:hypothetical protein [Actinomycetota bacterium]
MERVRALLRDTGFSLALAGHALVGIVIFLSGLVTHWAIRTPGLVAWVLGWYLIWRWWPRLRRVALVPIVLAGGYALALLIGDEFGLIGG